MIATKPIMFIFSIIILIVSLVFLLAMINSLTGSDEVLVNAKMDALRNAIDRACMFGNEQEVEDFELPQKKPGISIPVLPDVNFAKNKINSDGDPKYVVYYEVFPPGEGSVWEMYLDGIGNRALTPASPGNAIDDAISNANSLPELSFSWVWNLMPVNMNKTILGTPRSEEPELYKKYRYMLGEWKGNAYIFRNYVTLPKEVKSYVKYMPCGEKTLCLKTTTGIYKWKLNHCKNIKAIIIKISNIENNFYLASPCKTDLKVKKRSCEDMLDELNEDKTYYDMDFYSEDKESGTLNKEGTHTIWMGAYDSCDGNCNTFSEHDECILVTLAGTGGIGYSVDGFCTGSWNLASRNPSLDFFRNNDIFYHTANKDLSKGNRWLE